MSQKTIYKYPLVITDRQVVELPVGARLLHVDDQFGQLHLWALVEQYAPTEPRTFRIVGTGHHFDDSARFSEHVGTVMTPPFVWHVFTEHAPGTTSQETP